MFVRLISVYKVCKVCKVCKVWMPLRRDFQIRLMQSRTTSRQRLMPLLLTFLPTAPIRKFMKKDTKFPMGNE